MSFNVKLPDDPKVEDFKKAKAKLVSQYATKSASAPQKDEYAFGQKVAISVWNVQRAFKGALRTLCECCKLQTGTDLMTDKELKELDRDD